MTNRSQALVIAPMSRVDRAAGRMIRERDRKQRGVERGRATRAEAAAHEALIARLTKAHQVEFNRIDWADIEAQGPVVPTVARDAISAEARRRLAAYRPSLIDALFGLQQQKRRELTAKVVAAAKADAELYAKAKAIADRHNRLLALAPDVRALKVDAIAQALKANDTAAALKEVVEGFVLHLEGARRLVAQVDLIEFDALPDEACVAGAGSPTYRPITDEERYELQLANAASAALRAAIEVLQAAPLDTVEVVARLCRPGGLSEADMEPVLYAKVAGAALAKLQLGKLDAAPTLAAMSARIDWTSSCGLAPIELEDLGLAALRQPLAAA